MMHCQPRDHAIELGLIERQVLRVAALKDHVCKLCPRASRACLFQHLIGCIQGDHRCRGRGNGCRDHAWSAGDIEEVSPTCIAQRRLEARNDLVVRLFRPTIECVSLPCEFLCHTFEVIHGLSPRIHGALLSPVGQQVSYGDAYALPFRTGWRSWSAHREPCTMITCASAESANKLTCEDPSFDGEQHGRRMHVPTDPLSIGRDTIDRSCLPLPLVSARERDGARTQCAL